MTGDFKRTLQQSFPLIVLFLCLPAVLVSDEPTIRQVVLVFDRSQAMLAVAGFDKGLREGIEGNGQSFDFHREFLDAEVPLGAIRSEQQVLSFAVESIRRKYAATKVDLVIAFGAVPSDILPGAPTIYVGQPPNLGDGRAGARVPILSGDEFSRTMTAALALQPGVKNVVLISGTSPADRAFTWLARSQLSQFKGRVRFTDWTGLSLGEMREQIAHQTPDTIAFMISVWRDGAGRSLIQDTVLATLVPASSVPIYGVVGAWVPLGLVGGYVIDFEKLGAVTQQVASRILGGTDPRSIATSASSGHSYLFSGEQMRRWRLNESALPPGSDVRFRPPPFWETYLGWIFAATGILLVFAVTDFWRRHRKYKAESAGLQRQHEFEALISGLCIDFIDQPPDHIEAEVKLSLERIRAFLHLDSIRLYEFASQRALATAAAMHHSGGDAVDPLAIPEVRQNLQKNELVRFCPPLNGGPEPRAHAAARLLVPVEAAGRVIGALEFVPVIEENSSNRGIHEQLRTLGRIYGITLEHKRSQEALDELRGRLVNAQESERAAIARELHDDFSQRLALVAMTTEQVRRGLEGTETEEHKRLASIFDQTVKLSGDLRQMSHQLHTNSLEMLGLGPALRELCDELQKQHGILIDATIPEVIPALPPTMRLCLFRVAQQALTNVVIHSGTRLAELTFEVKNNTIELTVRDYGVGFDSTGTLKGLGLISMRERVKLEGGVFILDSQPGEGSEITARIPLRSDRELAAVQN